MRLYEVHLRLTSPFEEKDRKWLKSHMEEMLSFSGFKGASLYKIDSQNWVVHYQVQTLKDLDDYFEKEAPQMRELGRKYFGQRLAESHRRILEPLL